MEEPPAWVLALPAINASLNGLATVLLIWGYALIRKGNKIAHKRVMLTTFAVSILFLACYLTYHFQLQRYTGSSSKKFPEDHPARPIYLGILLSHVVLATAVPVLASITIYRGLKQQWDKHKKLAKLTFPIWVYVSITGVMIYWMLYHWAAVG